MVVAGGGTGGHLFPGLALAEAARRRGVAEVLFIGSAHGIEARVIPTTGFALRTIPVRGVRGRGLRGLVSLLTRVPYAVLKAASELRRFGPDIVVGVGGYASFPVIAAAWLQRVPSVLLEQNARPGMTTRVLARFSRAVCTAFPEAAAHLPGATVVCTGNPVRRFEISAPRPARSTFTLLIFGGSQGAHRINVEAVAAVRVLAAQISGLQVIHQTGSADYETVKGEYGTVGVNVDVRPFITDMGAAYAQADLVVCRAGATTLAEIAALGKAAILIPYPFAADDHQRANAESLQRRGAADLILDRDLTSGILAERILGLVRDGDRLESMRRASAALGRPDAAERVLDVCERVVAGGHVG